MIGKILIGIGVLVLILISVFFLSLKFNQSQPPPKLMANFMDINKVKQISKYRSCAGHTVVPQDGREMKRNMKHYIEVYPEFRKEETVELYSPYDGYVSLIRADMADKLEGEIWIAPERGPGNFFPPFDLWTFSFEHMQPRKDLKTGSKVKTGELVGYASFLVKERTEATFDVIYGTMGLRMGKLDNWNSPFGDLDSIFNHMSDEVFAQYQKRGITRENIIVSKEERDQNPCTYRDQGPLDRKDRKDPGPYFENSGDPANWIKLKEL